MLTTKVDRLIETGANRGPERAILVAVESSNRDTVWSSEDSLSELDALARTAGAEVVGTILQRLWHLDSNTYLGKGRAQELSEMEKQLKCDLVIFDDELTPTQQRNLEKMLDARVVDRTALILDIFAQHAHSREGQLQVELAQLEYRLPRLSGQDVEFTRQAGGSRGAAGGVGGAIGVRGPGETKLEIDRRRIRSRISDLKANIEDVRKQRAIHRRQRAAQAIPVIAVVGYTNAGKSTLFNILADANVLAEDKLFATLDPVTRHIVLPNHQEVLLTDTVGFIQKLPTRLIAAFRATLEEIIEADILLEVVDVSHENAIEQSETVQEILDDLGAQDKPHVTALNKIDLLDDPEEVDTTLYPNAVPISALDQQGLDELMTMAAEVLTQNMVFVDVLIPYTKGDLVELFHRRGNVEDEEHQEGGIHMIGRIPRSLHGFYSHYFAY
ncbi:GTPase HflX [Ktedonobacteria bacterium brp13]|nr:GTPase HflX [Ktedonobacteria bacterium brp13]